MSDGRAWFVTGASSGFGRALAEAAVGRGDRVAGRVGDRYVDHAVYAMLADDWRQLSSEPA